MKAIKCTLAELPAISRQFPPGVLHVLLLHDDACIPGVCVCEPDCIVQELTVEACELGERAEAAWRSDAEKNAS